MCPVVITFWLRLDRLIKPCFLPASLLLSLYIALTFTHITSRSLWTPTLLLAFSITCVPSHTHAFLRFTYLSMRFPHSAYFAFLIAHFTPLYILACIPCLLDFSLFLILCVVAVPFRVEHICLRHSSLGAVRPDILPHQQCCWSHI